MERCAITILSMRVKALERENDENRERLIKIVDCLGKLTGIVDILLEEKK